MHDEEAASPPWKLNPKNFGPNIKSVHFLGLRVKTRVGRVSGNNKDFLGLRRRTLVQYFHVFIGGSNENVKMLNLYQSDWVVRLTQSDPVDRTRPDPTRLMDGPDPCPTVRCVSWDCWVLLHIVYTLCRTTLARPVAYRSLIWTWNQPGRSVTPVRALQQVSWTTALTTCIRTLKIISYVAFTQFMPHLLLKQDTSTTYYDLRFWKYWRYVGVTHRVTHRVRLHLAQSSWPSAFTSSITLVQPRDL